METKRTAKQREAHRAAVRRYYAAHRAEINARQVPPSQRSPEAHRRANQRYYAANHAEIQERRRASRAAKNGKAP